MVIKRRHIAVFFLLFSLLISVTYLFFFRPLVEQSYHDNAPEWFSTLVDELYPRFAVEKQRFDLAFFQYKADQVIIRLSFIMFLSGIGLWYLNPARFINRHTIELPSDFYRRLRLFFYAGLLLYTWNWYEDFSRIVKMEEFYKGIHLFRFFGVGIPEIEIFYGLFAVYLISLFLVLIKNRPVLFASFTALGLVIFQGYLYSFEKIEHGYTTLTYACMLMPFLFYELKVQNENEKQKSFVLFLIQLSIAGAYFLSGAEKLLTSGFQWADAETFRTYLLLHPQEVGLWVAEQPFLLHILPWMVLFFQLSFIVVPFYPRFRHLFLLSGIAFHWGTTWLMGIGAYLSPWIFVYVFFLDLQKFKIRFLSSASSTNISQNGA